MRRTLSKLTKLMKPLDGQKHTDVDWSAIESYLGLQYPDSFKDFVAVYGTSHWFDKLIPFYTPFSEQRNLAQFTEWIEKKFNSIAGNTYDDNFKPVEMPVYPKENGLFPFMADIDGNEYFWHTNSRNPNRWPVYCWMTGQFVILEKATICSMLVGFLQRDHKMVELWGDVEQYDPGRIQIADVCAESW